jgi:serine/threonine protein kinase
MLFLYLHVYAAVHLLIAIFGLVAVLQVHLQLKHKHIVRMRKSFEDHENLYLVMEYCEGGDLFQYLQQRKRYLIALLTTQPTVAFLSFLNLYSSYLQAR